MTKRRPSSPSRRRAAATPSPRSSPPPSSSSAYDDLAPLLRLSSIDLADRLGAALDAEVRPHYRCADYLGEERRRRREGRRRGSEAALDAPSRGRVVAWLYDCGDYLRLSRERVAVAANLADRFVSAGRGRPESAARRAANEALDDPSSYQLCAIASLSIAAKLDDRDSAADLEALAEMSCGAYSVEEIAEAEATILDALDWRLCAPTPQTIASHLVALLAKTARLRDAEDDDARRRRRHRIGDVTDFARLQLERSVEDYETSVLRRPSTVALAAVLNAVELLDFQEEEVRSFQRSLCQWTNGRLNPRSEEAAEVRRELHKIVDGRSSADLAEAEVKEGRRPREPRRSVSSSRSPVGVEELGWTVKKTTKARRGGPGGSSRASSTRSGRDDGTARSHGRRDPERVRRLEP
ncbi:hypothetical protein ACHAWF_003299 [Thalassiosira exigua]